MAQLSDFAFLLEVAFGAGPHTDTISGGATWSGATWTNLWAPPGGSSGWSNLTSDVRAADGVTLTSGRATEFDPVVQAGTASWVLKNPDGRYTMGYGSSPYALRLRVPCRWRVAYGGTTYDLWGGFVDSWGNAREQTLGLARISASDRIARSVKIKLRSNVQAEQLYDAPLYCYPLTEDGQSLSAGDVTGVPGKPTLQVRKIGSGGAVDFGVGAAPGPDAGTVVAFTPTDAFNYSYLEPAVPAQTIRGGSFTVEAWLRPGTTGTGMNALGGVLGQYAVGVDNLGKPYAAAPGKNSGSTIANGPTALSTTALTHVVAVFVLPAIAGGTGSVSLYVDGLLADSQTFTALFPTSVSLLPRIGDGWNGQVSHVAVYSGGLAGDRIAAHAQAGTGFTGEASDQRFLRWCRLAGVPASWYSTTDVGRTLMGPQPSDGQMFLDLLRQVADAENGTVYVAGPGGAGVLAFTPRRARYNQTYALTLDASKPGQVDTGFQLTTDDQFLLNDLTGDRPGGATTRVLDQASIDAYDVHEDSITLYVADDDQLAGAVAWRVAVGKDPRGRSDGVTVDVVGYVNSGGNLGQLLGADTGTMFRAITMPTDTAPSSTVLLRVEGRKHQLDKDRWLLTFTTSPVGPETSVWQLGRTGYSELGSTTRVAY